MEKKKIFKPPDDRQKVCAFQQRPPEKREKEREGDDDDDDDDGKKKKNEEKEEKAWGVVDESEATEEEREKRAWTFSSGATPTRMRTTTRTTRDGCVFANVSTGAVRDEHADERVSAKRSKMGNGRRDARKFRSRIVLADGFWTA